MDKIAFLMYWADKPDVSGAQQDRIIIAHSSAEERIKKDYSGSWNLVGKIRFDDSRELDVISNDLAAKLGSENQRRLNGPFDCSVEIPRYQRKIIGSAFVQYFLKK